MIKLVIIGAGNIGLSIARGLVTQGIYGASEIILTRRKLRHLEGVAKEGFIIQTDNVDAVHRADLVIIAVEPQQLDGLLEELKEPLEPKRHRLISVVSGVKISQIRERLGYEIDLVRAMPNTAIAIGESMTCLCASDNSSKLLKTAEHIFSSVGRTLIISEEQMIAATALGACGIAFFLRAIRAASQGGIEIGFHYDDARFIAAQTARGAASLLLKQSSHPEHEIDRVTTPRGCTITGLNEMEHRGFSSAMIKGILSSAEKAGLLY